VASPDTWPSLGPSSTDILDLVDIPFPFGLYPALFTPSHDRFVPESPRWLISKGSVSFSSSFVSTGMAPNNIQLQESKALRILARFHAIGFDENDPFIQYEVTQIQNALRMERESKKNVSFGSLFASPGNRKRMRIVLGIAFFSQWR
jgi:hypothetical protein